MEPTTETGFFITLGEGDLTTKAAQQGQRVPLDLDGWGVEDLETRLMAPKGTPSWWSAHTWRAERPDEIPPAEREKRAPHPRDYRGGARWEAASCIALDLDYAAAWKADGSHDHSHPPAGARDRFDTALMELPPELERGAVLAHHTPRGARLVLLLTEPITDRDLFVRAAAGADALVSRWLEAAGLRADQTAPPMAAGSPLARPGYEVDHKAARDLARVLWAPRAWKTGEPEPRRGEVKTYGDSARRFSARELVAFAPASVEAPKTDTAKTHDAHPSWPVLEGVLAKTPGARKGAGKVEVRCPFHGPDNNPSAVVFASGVLSCEASGCEANKGKPLERWANTRGGIALLGENLARLLTATVKSDAAPATRLEDFWRTVSEWQNLDGASWFDEPPPARKWLLTVPENALYPMRRVLPRGVVGMIAAGGSVGKTMALTQLAVAVATGKRWLTCDGGKHEDFPGFETPEEGGRVLLALGEEDAGEARRRLHSAVMGAGLTRDEKARCAERIVVLPLMGQGVQLIAPADKLGEKPPQPTPFALELRARLMESPEPWSLVIIDPLSRWAGADTETDNAAATKFVQLLETFTDAPGNPTVLVAHHTTKGAKREGATDDTAARGASALSDGVRWHALMTAKTHPEGASGVGVPRMAELRVVKTNYGVPLDETLWLARDEGGWLRAAKRTEKAAFVEASQGESGKGAPQRKAKDDGALKVLR